MRTIAKLGIVLCMGGVLSYGATWNRVRLLDASCSDNGKVTHIGSVCAPTASTTNFAFETIGARIYKLDAASNDKAMKAVADGVVKADRYGDYRASITGHRESGRYIMVKSISHGRRSEQ